MDSPAQIESPQFCRTKQLCYVLEISRSTLCRWIAEKRFPAPLKMGGRNVWLWSDVLNFIESLGTKRDEAVAA